MPRIAFEGFATGSAVALSATQGAATASASVSEWGQEMTGLEITASLPPRLTAPMGIWFEATDLSGFALDDPGIAGYDPAFNQITFVWTVRDAPLAAYTAPQNMLSEWNDANVAYGKKVALFFPDPGTYVVDLWCVDRHGNTATAEYSVTVEDPATVYPGTRTVCFSDAPGETFAGIPAGAMTATTAAAAEDRINAIGGPARLLIKRGLVTDAFSEDQFTIGTGDELEFVGAWGSGAKPVLTGEGKPFRSTGGPLSQLTVTGIRFEGPWDTTTETGKPIQVLDWSANPSSCHYTLWDTEFSGISSLDPGVNATSATILIGNCIFENWRDYGILQNDSQVKFAIVGSRMAQNPDANGGGYGKTVLTWNQHGPGRIKAENGYLAVLDLFSNTSWAGGHQPCLRINTGAGQGYNYMLDRIVAEGGNTVLNFNHSNRNEGRPGNYVVDKALLISSAFSGRAIRTDFGGFTARNVVFVQPDVKRAYSGGWGGFLGAAGDINADGTGNFDAPIEVYNCTLLALFDLSDIPTILAADDDILNQFTDITEENNVIHAPNLGTPQTLFDPIDTATAVIGVTPRCKGLRYGFEPLEGTLAQNVPPGGSFEVPYSAITRDRPDMDETDTPPTDQAYWQAIEGIDTGHRFYVDKALSHAEDGDIAVAFTATGAEITNLTDKTWPAGKDWDLFLDRGSLITTDASYASPTSIALPRPLNDAGGQGVSGAIDAGDAGLRAYDDFFGVVRPNPDLAIDHRGAAVPDSGNERGALLEV